MKVTKLPHTQISLTSEIDLPEITLIDKSHQACAESFLRVGYSLSQYLEQIESAVATSRALIKEPLVLAALGLFSKLRCHYYSSVLLEIHHSDPLGSQFLVEQLYETAITLTYLLEEADESHFLGYINVSVCQARHLLTEVEAQLQRLPDHRGLLQLSHKLKALISQKRLQCVSVSTVYPETFTWGAPEADTTAKRGTLLGLGFLSNPVRKTSLRVEPASWLDLQLNYLNPSTSNSQTLSKPGPNFKGLRDTAHLCLHATQAFLEEIVRETQDSIDLDLELLYNNLSKLFEWFHHAYNASQRHYFIQEPASGF